MGYMLKTDIAKDIQEKYKNSYFTNKLGISNTYVSLIVHRKQKVPRRIAYAFTKAINVNAELEDYFSVK